MSVYEMLTVLQIHEIKKHLNDKNAPFGVDLLLPQVGGSARKTNVNRTSLFGMLFFLT